MIQSSHKYRMSFGTGGLSIAESAMIARARLRGLSWERAADTGSTDAFQTRKAGSAKRLAREATHRLRLLDQDELELLVDGTRPEQAALLWTATCRTYRFIREWTLEVLVERGAIGRQDVNYGDFDRFFAEKEEQAPELARLTGATRTKLRAVLFRFMREAGLLGTTGELTLAPPPLRVADLLSRERRSGLAYFPVLGLHRLPA